MGSNSPIDKTKIEDLVEKYRLVLKNRREDEFDEEDVKNKFLNPLLEALGWDVRGLDEVKFEQKTLKGRTDFGLKIKPEGKPVLFIEAKSFDESLDGYRKIRGEKQTYPEQAIDDAWSMKVDWVVLTNFKKLRLYYSHVKKPEDGLQFELKFKDFLSEEGIEKLNTLTKESVKSGSLQKYEVRRTRENVNTEFVNDLYSMRKTLAGSINKNNDISKEELRESVQRILDRLVVIRVAEDREILHRESLHKMVETWETTSIDPSVRTLMRDLKNLFRDFDSVYNSKLFEEHMCETLEIDNHAVKEIINSLYDYNFDLINADVLGEMYEDYIGHILKEKGEGVDIKEDHQTRKKSGIYYTPSYVVDFLVNHTVGKLIRENSEPGEVSDVNVLDPACGSGSFLIKAFDYFKDYYDEYNQKVRNEARKSGTLGSYDMVKDIEKKILSENLYGVDLDEQAAEIASVNLMLKGLRKNEKLPLLLGENLRIGNSLISRSIEEIEDYFDRPEEKKPLEWEDQFSGVFEENEGFDVVIGNPPYINVNNLPDEERDYLMNSGEFETAMKRFDIYLGFIERGIQLLEEGGRLGFIIPHPFLNQDYAEGLRKYILDTCCIETIVDLSDFEVFRDPNVRNILLIIRKESNEETRNENNIDVIEQEKDPSISARIEGKNFSIPQKVYKETYENMFRLDLTEKTLSLLEKIDDKSFRLGRILVASWGARGSPIKDFHLDEKINSKCKKMIKGENIGRYSIDYAGKWFLYDQDKLYRPAFPELFENKKLIISKVTGKEGLISAYDDNEYYTDDSLCCCVPKFNLKDKDEAFFGRHKIDMNDKDVQSSKKYDLKFILGIVNSKLTNFYFKTMLGYELNVYPESIEQLPVPEIDFQTSSEKEKYNKVIELVDKITSLKGQEDWIESSFSNLLMNYDLTEEKPLSNFYNPRDQNKLEKFDINLAKTWKIASEEMGVINEYKVDLKEDSVLISVRYKDESDYEKVLDLHFESDTLKEFFFLALKRNEGNKDYRSEKPVFETTMEDLTVPKSTETKLIDENVKDFKTVMDVLKKNFEKKVSEEWNSNFISELNLTKIEHEIEQTDKAIDRIVYDLYGLTDEEIETVESAR